MVLHPTRLCLNQRLSVGDIDERKKKTREMNVLIFFIYIFRVKIFRKSVHYYVVEI